MFELTELLKTCMFTVISRQFGSGAKYICYSRWFWGVSLYSQNVEFELGSRLCPGCVILEHLGLRSVSHL